MKKIITMLFLAILFCLTASAQILSPYPEPEITKFEVKEFGISGMCLLSSDSAKELYFAWADSLYDIYPACLVKLLDGSTVFTLPIDMVSGGENIIHFLERKRSENVPMSHVVREIHDLYLLSINSKNDWTQLLRIL